jgi:GPI mannosyltransferase 4
MYALLIVLRVLVGVFLPGYVHPDEFFQGGQELFFGCPPFVPWELEPRHAVRSIVPPTVMTWLPLRLYSWVIGIELEQLTGREVLVVPRWWCAIASVLAIDTVVYLMTTQTQRQDGTTIIVTRNTKVPTNSMWILATSWPAWVLVNRPFTNGVETMFLAIVLYLTMGSMPIQQRMTIIRNVILGITCAIGLFTRFTIVFFVMPAMMIHLIRTFSAVGGIIRIASCSVAFLGTAGLIILADTVYYGGTITDWTSFIAPWNAFRYNSRTDNLQNHGLHPRWTHAVVNMFILFGPMALFFYASLAITMFRRSTKTTVLHLYTLHQGCVWTIVSGLSFLSLAPHQEPRFLTPLIVPLCIVMGATKLWSSVNFRLLWIAFNVVLFVVFGILHQGGIVPAILSNDMFNHDEPPLSILFYRTYMPPSFLSRRRHCSDKDVCAISSCPQITLHDLNGSDAQSLTTALVVELQCSELGNHEMAARRRYVHLVAPPFQIENDHDHGSFTMTTQNGNCQLGSDYSCERIWTYWPHLTTEDFPVLQGGSISNFMASFQLSIYKIGCHWDHDLETTISQTDSLML